MPSHDTDTHAVTRMCACTTEETAKATEYSEGYFGRYRSKRCFNGNCLNAPRAKASG